jgi:hypothetical protein
MRKFPPKKRGEVSSDKILISEKKSKKRDRIERKTKTHIEECLGCRDERIFDELIALKISSFAIKEEEEFVV